MNKTVKINGVKFELRDVTDKDYAEAVHVPENMNIRYVARVVETEYPEYRGLKIGSEYFVTYHYNTDLSDVVRLSTSGEPETKEDTSMEMTNELLEEIMMGNKEKPLTEMFNDMILNSGNSEELVMRVTGLDKYHLELFFTYIIYIYLDASRNGYDTKKVQHAVKILGKEVHYKPFSYLATMDYFGEEDYKAIVETLEFVMSNEEFDIEEEV